MTENSMETPLMEQESYFPAASEEANKAGAAGTAAGYEGPREILAGGAGKETADSSKRVYYMGKRLFDLTSATLLFVILSPLIGALLLIKWLEDFHNPVYISERVGQNGKFFHFYKIRSMRPDAEKLKKTLIEQNKNEADGPAFKMKNDPRITPFGRFLRRTSLDEILQLVNIIKGDMSVVGPRPPLPEEVERYTPLQRERLSVKGGLLCLWQIQPDRHTVSFDEWVHYDLAYIEQQSFSLDLKIICRGAFMVFSGKSGD